MHAWHFAHGTMRLHGIYHATAWDLPCDYMGLTMRDQQCNHRWPGILSLMIGNINTSVRYTMRGNSLQPACENIKFDNFFQIFMTHNFFNDTFWLCNFQKLLNIEVTQVVNYKYYAPFLRYMTCYVIGCSLCPHTLLSQAQSHIIR